MEANMESSDHMEYLEEKVAQMLMQHEFLNNTFMSIADKLDHLMQAQTQNQKPMSTTSESHETPPTNKTTTKRHIKLLPPSDFNRDHAKGRTFLNSCELYICLAQHQFASESDKVSWVLTYMKSRWASLFVN